LVHQLWDDTAPKNPVVRFENVNTIVKQKLKLNGEDIKRSSDFCYLGSIVAENGGTSREVQECRRRGDHSSN